MKSSSARLSCPCRRAARLLGLDPRSVFTVTAPRGGAQMRIMKFDKLATSVPSSFNLDWVAAWVSSPRLFLTSASEPHGALASSRARETVEQTASRPRASRGPSPKRTEGITAARSEANVFGALAEPNHSLTANVVSASTPGVVDPAAQEDTVALRLPSDSKELMMELARNPLKPRMRCTRPGDLALTN
jgi:hypothetical protein